MSLIDRYIARQYITNIVVLFIIIVVFVITIDVSLNIDRLWGRAVQLAGPAGREASTGRLTLIAGLLVWDLWWPRLIQLFTVLSGLIDYAGLFPPAGLILIAAMGFTCRQLVRHRELVAVLTSGQSLYRIARPIVMVALGVMLLQLLTQELVIPRIAPLLARDHGDAGKRTLKSTAVPLTRDSSGRVLRAAKFDPDQATLDDLYVIERDEHGLAERRITAPRARWANGGWNLVDGLALERGDDSVRARPIARLETSLDPLALKALRFKGYSQHLSWRQIGQMLDGLDRAETDHEQRTRHRLERTRYGRLATAGTNLLTLLIAMTFVLRREPIRMMGPSIKCAVIGVVALMGGAIGSAAAIPGFPPQVSVFLPYAVLVPVAIALLGRVRS